MSSIILIGYRGTGKSAVAKCLAAKLRMKSVSTDDEIVKKVGNISRFVKKNGWEKFRIIESSVLKKIAKQENIILDCGGGIVERKKNIALLKRTGTLFWLKANVPTIVKRIKNSKTRPSLTGNFFLDEIRGVLKKRTPLYNKTADYEIKTDDKTVSEVAQEIMLLSKTQVCIPITAASVQKALADMKKAEKKAEMVELRIDYMKDINEMKLGQLLKNKKKKTIVTCRKENFRGTEKERTSLLKKALALGADFVDVEIESKGIKIFINDQKKTIISYHDFKETPSLKELEKIHEKIKRLNPALIKIVTLANSINDNFRIFKLLEKKKNLVAFCMGQKGEISRILAPKFGSSITFASLERNKESAAGQLTIDEMQNIYAVSRINPETEVFGLIGEHAEHSDSKNIHNAMFQKLGLNCVYVGLKVEKNELDEFMKNFRKFDFRGASVTIPHKQTIMKHIDRIESDAKRIGAVNTIVRKGNSILGFNTDCIGAVKALGMKLKSKKVLVLGAGGASRAVVYGLKKEGAIVTIANRTNKKAENVAREFKISSCDFNKLDEIMKDVQIIINTTSVGMTPREDESLIEKMPSEKVVMDIVYKPRMTKLLEVAEKSGCKAITGDRMLIHQGIAAFKLWTGKNASFKIMDDAITKTGK
ncbi:shikimate dehydrogenase [Candidatus Woesearchaeota archaeon]|nr:shikimate dehydrogenase [Candidatus Woesearchaeota archaeon]